MEIVAFDFDGTLTHKDSLLEFIKYSKGKIYFYIIMLLFLPLLVAYRLGLYPNWKIKEKLFSFLYKGMEINDFNELCMSFFYDKKSLLRDNIIDRINYHRSRDAVLIIVSASIENWVLPFAEFLGINIVLGTKIEVKNNRITGVFNSKNCYGKEKVERILNRFPERSSYKLIAYGDSKGDLEMMNFADESYYKYFG